MKIITSSGQQKKSEDTVKVPLPTLSNDFVKPDLKEDHLYAVRTTVKSFTLAILSYNVLLDVTIRYPSGGYLLIVFGFLVTILLNYGLYLGLMQKNHGLINNWRWLKFLETLQAILLLLVYTNNDNYFYCDLDFWLLIIAIIGNITLVYSVKKKLRRDNLEGNMVMQV